MKVFVLLVVAWAAAAITFVTNWLALIPWRRAKAQHWSERARLYHPVRSAAASNVWVVPLTLTLSVPLLLPESPPHWAWLLFAAALGSIAGTIPMDREVFPRIQWPDLIRQVAFAWSMQVFPWLVLAGALIAMPNVFNLQSASVAIAAIALTALWSHGGFIRVGQILRFFVNPTETLQKIVRDTAARMNVPVKRVWLLRIPLAQAWALPPRRTLIFTVRLLQLCPSEEVEAICAHELAHLKEPFLQYASRYVLWLTFLPFIFIVPAINTFGAAGLFVIFCPVLVAPTLYRRVSRKLEVRADQIAHASQPSDQAYARALMRLHEDALLPAVLAKSHATHPHLYDRLTAAGMTPDFPRPKAAKSMAWHGRLFAVAIGVIVIFLLSRP